MEGRGDAGSMVRLGEEMGMGLGWSSSLPIVGRGVGVAISSISPLPPSSWPR